MLGCQKRMQSCAWQWWLHCCVRRQRAPFDACTSALHNRSSGMSRHNSATGAHALGACKLGSRTWKAGLVLRAAKASAKCRAERSHHYQRRGSHRQQSADTGKDAVFGAAAPCLVLKVHVIHTVDQNGRAPVSALYILLHLRRRRRAHTSFAAAPLAQRLVLRCPPLTLLRALRRGGHG